MAVMDAEHPATLAERWAALRETAPSIRTRDAAAELGVSEAELVASDAGWSTVRLSGDFGALLERLPEVGEIMALTRNPHAVHEKVGAFGDVRIGPGHGLVLNHDIDLRLFMGQWRHGFEVTDVMKDGQQRRSLQFFDAAGQAVHKIYERKGTDTDAWTRVVRDFLAEDQNADLDIRELPGLPADLPDDQIDVDGLRAHWADLKDVHDFFGMLKDFRAGRLQAMRLVGAPYVEEVEPTSARAMLEAASRTETPIMCFVGNRGCIQIHSGPVKEIKVMGPWLNVLDPGFNLHLREDHIARAFVVQKPTRDGHVTSLELFAPDGGNFAMFFGLRKEGQPELDAWRDILAGLPRLPSDAV
jgi:putative hemin transport protein